MARSYSQILAQITIWVLVAACVVAATGCRTYKMPDPNNPEGQRINPEILSRNVETFQHKLRSRIESGEIDDEERRRLITEYVQDHVEGLEAADVDPIFAWHYGDVFRELEEWTQAYEFYKVAAENAQSEDRRVNDHLRLAQAAAMLDRPDEAIQIARSIFDAPPTDKAPILPAILYEVAPAASGKGVDEEVAQLLVDAVDQHLQVVVDSETEAGLSFIVAKPHHISLAYTAAIRLHQNAGNIDKARELVNELDEVLSRFGQV